jgi:hypothetical protein
VRVHSLANLFKLYELLAGLAAVLGIDYAYHMNRHRFTHVLLLLLLLRVLCQCML